MPHGLVAGLPGEHRVEYCGPPAPDPDLRVPCRRGQALPEGACPACGTAMAERRARLTLPVNGEEIAVPSAPHLRCPKCREVVLRYEDARRLREDAIAIYRRK